MSTPALITPCRGDFFATDTGTAVLKIAIENRETAHTCGRLGRPSLVKVYRDEMRYYAQIAVRIARRCRADRT